LDRGDVSTLLVLGSNPVYTAPADFKFADALQKAKVKIHAGQYQDETSALCDWHVPTTHALEAWGDARAFDGTASIVQPLIAPLFGSRSEIEIINRMTDRVMSGYDAVRDTWRKAGLGVADFEKGWNRAVHDGVVPNTASKPVTVRTGAAGTAALPVITGTEITFRTDPTIYDGRYANNGWLQELPKSMTKLTWDNAAILSPATAQSLGVQDDDQVKITVGSASVVAGVIIIPGHADDTVAVYVGSGRTKGGTVATATLDENGVPMPINGGGFDAYPLRSSDAADFAGCTVEKAPGLWPLASTQGHVPLDDSRITDRRDIVRDYAIDKYEENIDAWHEEWMKQREEWNSVNLYPDQTFDSPGENQWGMTIDMNTCTGCGACVTACQSENNIPVVGKIQVKRNRWMHWIRIDRYYSGPIDNPKITFQPVMCVHCEKAPCEPVCPVGATVHSHEGLNMMIYNRCVGTRYCSNNCPYKVRKFNFLNFSDNQPNFSNTTFTLEPEHVPGPVHRPKGMGIELLRMINNPDVTVRGRGIMEKCTYCTQRISEARIEAKKGNREIKDGEILTACQQACPTNTIVFGNIADENAKVTALRKDPRAYLLLEELATRPRTSHLAKLRNPNRKIEPEVAA